MLVVFATIRRCVMSVKNCIAPTKKPKSTRQGHSILQVYILRPGRRNIFKWGYAYAVGVIRPLDLKS